MTRENKLALVVGFALILFVGILISDHFSAFQSKASADLSKNIKDPLAHVQADQPGLIDYQLLTNPTEIPSSPDPASPSRNDDNAVFMGQLNSTPEVIGLDETQLADLSFTFHEVRPGESLTSIANHYFSDPSLATELASYNRIDDPNHVSAGRRIRIPKKTNVLIRGGTPTDFPVAAAASINPAAPPATPPPPTYASYTIKSGDVLSKLSQELLGTMKRMNELVELNRDVITNPDRLIPGKVIRVPKD